MLEAHGLSVSLGHRPILHDVTAKVRAQEVTAIVGLNGSGKTTLLRALSGEFRDHSAVQINGRPIGTLRLAELATLRAVLPQATTLAFPFTVHEVVSLGLIGTRAATAHRLPEQALGRVGLGDYGGRFYQELSGGEQQRVQLARVLCQVWSPVVDGEPAFLLLDEPVAGLDLKHQLAVMRIAREFCEAGGGVLAVMHDLNLTAMFADHVIAMRDGRVAAAGTPGEVLCDDVLSEVFDCDLRVGTLPGPETPFVLPQSVSL